MDGVRLSDEQELSQIPRSYEYEYKAVAGLLIDSTQTITKSLPYCKTWPGLLGSYASSVLY